ncbi:MAG TPA: dihydrolipoyl dehydrogenase [Nevskiales bacterium]|nr:dihydrolipoyl dehydrogenase [Nevskiales bacterium]
MSAREVRVPDLGDFKDVAVIEVLVRPGDRVEKEQPLITLESDKATMEVPATEAGIVKQLNVKVGDKVSAGDSILVLEPSVEAPPAPAASKPASLPPTFPEKPSKSAASSTKLPQNADIMAEVMVLGAGPGGYSAAFRAADLGKKVVLVERYPSLGGVCLNVGCIPSKALLHAAKVIEDAGMMAKHGIRFGPPTIDLPELRQYKTSVVTKLTGGLKGLAKRRKVSVVQGVGRFTGPHSLEVTGADGKKLLVGFEAAIIAAGSAPIRLPGLPDDPRIMDSTAALELPDIPERLLVIGGGIIGLEMANVYAALGSKVDVVEMTPGLLPGADPDLVKPLHKRMQARLAAIYTATKVAGIEAKQDALHVKLEGKDAPASKVYDRVLVAVGRRPNGHGIGAEAAGVTVDARGFIPTDAQLRTNVPHIFAIGDVTKPPLLAHKAVHEGKTAAEVIAGHKAAFDARCIPSVVYTDPEVAWTGLTELEAKAAGIEVSVGRFPWAANGRSLGMGYSDGVTKILFDKTSGRALGGAAVGPNAGELMAEISLAIEMGADAQDIGLTVHAHPTLSETVAMSAEQVTGTLTDL